jgi:regulatory protein YycI of two-component signal transduction system YycFG
MDWAKAKTILIAVFLAINAFLAYMIITANTGSIGYVDGEKVKQITGYLSEKNITVKGQVPLRKFDLPSIWVKHNLFDKAEISSKLFQQGEKAAEAAEDSTVKLTGGSREIIIKDNKELSYFDSSIMPLSDINEKDCIRHIKEFLGKLGLEDNASIRYTEKLEGYRRYIYKQAFKGYVLYNSEMEFYVNDYGVQRASIVWFDTIRQAGKKAAVISPEIAMLYLKEHYKHQPARSTEVIGVEQGYYFGVGDSEQVDTALVEEGTAFPVWKITTDRDIIYINAYNEKVEGVEKARK